MEAGETSIPTLNATRTLRSYPLNHEVDPEKLEPLLRAYRDAVNSVLEELRGNPN